MNSSSNPNPTNSPPSTDAAASPSAPIKRQRGRPRGGRNRNPYRQADRPAAPLMMTVDEAAETLRTTVEALRARLRRAQVVDADGNVTSPLGPGIVGVKFGANSWRVRFEDAK